MSLINKYFANKREIYETEILNFVEKNTVINEKYKSVYYCKSSQKPEGIMCIEWGLNRANEGDKVTIEGRFSGDVFIVYSKIITNKKDMPTNEQTVT